MNLLSEHEAIADDGFYRLAATGTVKLLMFMAYEPDQTDCSPEQQARNLNSIAQALALAKSRGFADGERLANLLVQRSPKSSSLVLALFDRLFACVEPEALLDAMGFDFSAYENSLQGSLQ